MNIALISCPQWSALCPPYNLCLLSSILKENSHNCKVYDVNIECFNHLKKTGVDYWEGQNYFYWRQFHFKKDLLPLIHDLLIEKINEILKDDPDIIGFSVYETNIECIKFMINKIKKKKPKVKIMVGGPECFRINDFQRTELMADFLFVGEAEQTMIQAIDSNELDGIYKSVKLTKLDKIPFADYSDLDLSKYIHKNSISMEMSRGCVANCSFCTETHFWPYRSKSAETLINEVKYYKHKYNVDFIRFNDSLVNGNMKEFSKFIDMLIEENLDILWDGYARIDGRMDLDFMKKIKKSGNIFLSFGVESGSQKVLDDMNKGIKIKEIEDNLRDAKEAGILSQLNWIIGFPTESCVDYLYSLTLINNNKDNIWQVCPGMTCGIGQDSDLNKNPKKYGIKEGKYWRSFATEHLKNTIIHRFIRLKLFHIFLDILGVENGQYHQDIKNDYTITFKNKKYKKIKYKDCINFEFLNKGSVESSLHSEYMSFFWAIYKAYGPFEMVLKFDYVNDKNKFGEDIVNVYDSNVAFSVDDESKWELDINHSLSDLIIFSESVKLKSTETTFTNIDVVAGNNSKLKKPTNDAFCPIPWIHSSCNTHGYHRVCCICCYDSKSVFRKDDGTYYDVNEDRIPRNHPILKSMRSSMIRNERHPLCEPCFERENSGFFSNRLINNVYYYPEVYEKALELTNKDGTIKPEDFPIQYYDIRMSNVCNSKCIMCNNASSTMWPGGYFYRATLESPYIKEMIENIHTVNRIYIAGGEPLIHKELWKLLKLIIDMGYSNNIDIHYNTNGTVMKKEFFDIWKNYNRVNLGFSIDGIGDVYEKIRCPSKWDKVVKNLKMFDELSYDNTFGVFTSTISKYNVLNIIDLFKWIIKQNFKKIVKIPHFNILLMPKVMNIRLLPYDEKLHIKKEYEKFYKWVEETMVQECTIQQSFSLIINSMMGGE
jgi:anaerobic magnesium-protoporphyrin IX monomethyl ester cyclase